MDQKPITEQRKALNAVLVDYEYSKHNLLMEVSTVAYSR